MASITDSVQQMLYSLDAGSGGSNLSQDNLKEFKKRQLAVNVYVWLCVCVCVCVWMLSYLVSLRSSWWLKVSILQLKYLVLKQNSHQNWSKGESIYLYNFGLMYTID